MFWTQFFPHPSQGSQRVTPASVTQKKAPEHLSVNNAYSFYQVHWQCVIPEHPAPSTPLTNSGQNGSFFLYLKRARASEESGELPKTSLGMATASLEPCGAPQELSTEKESLLGAMHPRSQY